MYLKIVDGNPEQYSVDQLRRDNPSTSFPVEPSAELLAGYGVHPYSRPDQPDCDWMTSRIIDGSFTKSKTGAWSQGYVVEQLPEAEAASNIRTMRNSLLQQTDWMALSDVAMPPDVAVYRQALREVTSQPGFPYAVVWPIKPASA